MTIYDELVARGLIAQVTDEEEIKETIQHNCDCFKKQMERFIDFSDGKALMVNNADWLLDLNYVDVLREIGPHFSVNRLSLIHI